MDWKSEWKPLAWIVTVFLACFWLPVGNARFDGAVLEAFHLVQWYAREHVLLCLVPAFFVAGAVAVFVSQASVMKYLGARANKVLAYGVASVSGSILAVCSCTVLPLFSGIHRMGAGLGPATAFLYSGPAINILAIVLTARVLGIRLGVARAVGAIVFAVLIGLCMHLLFRREEMDQLGLEYQLEKLTDITTFADYGVMMTPGLVVDGEVKSQGKVPTVDEIKVLLGTVNLSGASGGWRD